MAFTASIHAKYEEARVHRYVTILFTAVEIKILDDLSPSPFLSLLENA
jgi:hypothetical protein